MFFYRKERYGKTAITIQLSKTSVDVISICPEVFTPLNTDSINLENFVDNHQKPFKSIQSVFELTLQFELLYHLIERGKINEGDMPAFVKKIMKNPDNRDFDLRTVELVKDIGSDLEKNNDKAWLKKIKRHKELAKWINEFGPNCDGGFAIVIDRIDESWVGTDINIRFLTALMHACGEMTTRVNCARALLFLRENVFERVRKSDGEFSRLETRVVD